MEFLEGRELVDCDFIEEQMLTMYRDQDDTRNDDISLDANRSTPTSYFEVIPEPNFADFSHVPRGSANRAISPSDSFTTAEDSNSSFLMTI